MVKCFVQAATLLLLASLIGCGDHRITLATLEGEWKSTEGEVPALSLDAQGKGVLALSFSDAGGGGGGMSVSRVEVKQQEESFFIDGSITGSGGGSDDYRFELIPNGSQALTLKRVDSPEATQFVLKRQ